MMKRKILKSALVMAVMAFFVGSTVFMVVAEPAISSGEAYHSDVLLIGEPPPDVEPDR